MLMRRVVMFGLIAAGLACVGLAGIANYLKEQPNSKCMSCQRRFQIDGKAVHSWHFDTRCPFCGFEASFQQFYSNGAEDWNKR